MPSVGSVTSDQVAPDGAVVVVDFAVLERGGREIVEGRVDVVGVEVVRRPDGGDAVTLPPAHEVVTSVTPIATATRPLVKPHPRGGQRRRRSSGRIVTALDSTQAV
ncbi:MAG: hypothetical protein ACLQK4_09530 [Acidimicrobiales bacterium]|jgi:hypothetical protein